MHPNPKKLIALSGKMACGKSTISHILSDTYGFQVVSIALPIKKLSTLLIDNQLELQRQLNNLLDDHSLSKDVFLEFQTLLDTSFKNAQWVKTNNEYVKNDDYRKLLQSVATLLRNKLGDDIWAKFFAKEAKELSNQGQLIICDDLRLPSEMEALKQKGFYIIRIDIDKETQHQRILELYGEVNEELLSHPTEVSLDAAEFDFTINTGNKSLNENIILLKNFIKENEALV